MTKNSFFLKKRIKSINSILKITKAIKLVSIIKYKKVKKIFNFSIQYFNEFIASFKKIFFDQYFLLEEKEQKEEIKKEDKKTLFILVHIDFGFCGNFKSNLNKFFLKEYSKNDLVYLIGLKSKSFLVEKKVKFYKTTKNFKVNFLYSEVYDISLELLDIYRSNKFDSIKIVYTSFINSTNTKPVVFQLFPIIKDYYKESYKKINHQIKKKSTFESITVEKKKQIIKNLLLQYVNSCLFHILVESQTSEFSSRHLSMENSYNNAFDLSENLKLSYNKLRKNKITQSIIENSNFLQNN